MGQHYYYRSDFVLKDDINLLAVLQAYDPTITDEDLDDDSAYITWNDPYGPSFTLEKETRELEILMDGQATIHFETEFEDFLTQCANDFAAGGALLCFEGDDREPSVYGANREASVRLLADYRRNEIENARDCLRRTIAGTDNPMDAATEMVATLRTLLLEAIAEHVYEPGQQIPADCRYRQACDQAKALLPR